uniref:Uncharacterized protein n=1 Tax=Monodon monoceros TaxID=40151 RepID=A0A8C6CHV6_MONMO
PSWLFSASVQVCVRGDDGERQGWSRESGGGTGRGLHRETAAPGLPGPSYSLLARGLSFINRQLQSVVACIGLLPAPNLKTATFFTPGRPAPPPTLRHLGRWPTTGADQPPASKESQAGWGQRKGLSSEGEADFPIFFRRTFDYSAGGLQTHMG